MKTELKILALLLCGIALLFGLSALLDVAWVAARTVRQIIIYGLMLLTAWLFYYNLKKMG